MAKGLRASSSRANRRKLRATVFGPVEKARADRLHAKLLATIHAAKPTPEKKEMAMDVNESTVDAKDDLAKDIDSSATPFSAKKPNRTQSDRRTKNQRARKPRNSMTFPTARGKGALKPFANKGRVTKRT
ncbi:hypothetical protein EJ07DRAFT_137238 [Lizonia empirigonia]|nr:hypothetical protein EJ07DRAFT_137238 [Lizonia empirigonia]